MPFEFRHELESRGYRVALFAWSYV